MPSLSVGGLEEPALPEPQRPKPGVRWSDMTGVKSGQPLLAARSGPVRKHDYADHRRVWLMLPCGSASISSTRLPRTASPAAMWREVVVLPTPPFMFSTEIVRICFHMLHTRVRSGP